MYSVCVVCCKSFVVNKKQETCLACQKILKEEAPGVSLYGDGLSGIDDAIEELNKRIPSLFVGPECPGNCDCDCTYVSGCRLLKKKQAKSSTSEKNLETMKKVLDKVRLRRQVNSSGIGRGKGRNPGKRDFKGYEPHKTTKEEREKLLEKALSTVDDTHPDKIDNIVNSVRIEGSTYVEHLERLINLLSKVLRTDPRRYGRLNRVYGLSPLEVEKAHKERRRLKGCRARALRDVKNFKEKQ